MSTVQSSTKHNSTFARTIDNNKILPLASFHWLILALEDFKSAPLISLIYGVLFSLVPIAIFHFVIETSNHLIILPATIGFALIGPAFAAGLYDVAWELEKGHQPTISHSLKAMFRNPVGEWSFAIVLMIIMVAWTRIAALLHAFYPAVANPTFQELLPFLAVGTIVGAVLAAIVFTISAFTPQIMIERRVDIMTALATSTKAVNNNSFAMFIWACLIFAFVSIGLITKGYGFIFIMPILSYASWHGYIAVIKTKKTRKYE